MRGHIVSAAILCALILLPITSKANCANDVSRLITGASWPAKPSESDFQATLASVRLRAHLILKEELEQTTEQVWWQPKGYYFKVTYQARNSKNSVTALFDRDDGLLAYQVNSKAVASESVCINARRISSALADLTRKPR